MERLHVASKYEIEYGHTTCSPNWQGSMYNAFAILGAEPSADDSSDPMYADYFDCPIESYDDAIKELKNEIANPKEMSISLKQELDALNMTAEELLSYMERFRKEADTHDGYLHFFSF